VIQEVKRLMSSVKQTQLDPLYVIFEQHLYNFQDPEMDRKTFIDGVLKDYLSFLRKNHILIPKSLESSISEELSGQIQMILVKKIYGCMSIQEFIKNQPSSVKRQARARYSKLSKKTKKKA
jgi:hypothetical protein